MPKSNSRLTRINDELLRETAHIIRGGLKDPRISEVVSVTKVDTTNDLKTCKINISILGGPEEKARTMEGLKNATGFIRRELASRVNLRNTPELLFVLDESMEQGFKLAKLIDDVNRPLKEREQEQKHEQD